MKREQDFLDTLTEAAHHEFASDTRWEKLSRNELSEAEVDELRALAVRFEALPLFDACRPSTQEKRDQLYGKYRKKTTPPRPWFRRLRRPASYIAAGLAAAAAVGLIYRLREPEMRTASAPVPKFFLDPLSGDAENRAVAPTVSNVPHFSQESDFNLVFRPKIPIEGSLEARGLLLRGDEARAWNPDVSFQPNGVGRIQGKAGRIFPGIPSGKWQICLLVGRVQALPMAPPEITKKCLSPESRPRDYWPLLQDIEIQGMDNSSAVDGFIPALAVETNGCRRVRVGPICTIPQNGKINLWARASHGGDLHISIDEHTVTKEMSPVHGGFFIRLDALHEAKGIFVKEMVEKKVVGAFQLRLEKESPIPGLDEAEVLRSQNEYDKALEKLDSLSSNNSSFVQAQVKRMRARIARTQGNAKRAIELFNESIPLDREHGMVSDEIDDRLVLAFTLLMNSPERKDRFVEAARAFEGMDQLAAQSPEGHASISYFRGLLALETGNLSRAVELFRKGHDEVERVRREDLRLAITLALADALSALGRFSEARDKLAEVERGLAPDADPCTRGSLLTNLGWQIRAEHRAVSAGDATREPKEKALEVSREALHIYQKDCKQPTAIANVLANMALMSLDVGKPQDARRYLDDARATTPEPSARVTSDWLLAEGYLALAQKNPDVAVQQFDKVAAIAQREGSTDHQVDATVGRARALESMGKLADADHAYAKADSLLEGGSLLIPMGNGRLSFVARYEEVARHRMSFLLRQAKGEPRVRAERLRFAVDVARRNRARVLAAMQWLDRINYLNDEKRSLWDQSIADYRDKRQSLNKFAEAKDGFTGDDHDVATDKYNTEQQRLEARLNDILGIVAPTTPAALAPLPPLGEGELLLVYHPTVDGWVGFAVTTEDVVAIPLANIHVDMNSAELAQKLLDPFGQNIDRATRIRFAAYGFLDQIRFHALPWNRRALIHHAPVTYGLDLPARVGNTVDKHSRPHAVIVANSKGDLPKATEEANTIGRHLESLGWDVTTLVGDTATHEAVADALSKHGTALLHVAGHAAVEGVDGWKSAIPLAKGGAFTLGDIVTLPQVPRLVVLSACDGDKHGDSRDKAVLTLAEAFAVAGAREVVAAVDKVVDKQAQSMMLLFYQALRPDSAPDAPALLRAAALKAAQDTREVDWATFRIVVP